MKINTRDFLIVGLFAVCILSQTITTSASGSGSGAISADTGSNLLSGLGSNLGLNSLLSAPLSIANNLPLGLSTGSATNTASSSGSTILNTATSVDPNALLGTAGSLLSTGSNLLGTAGSVTSTGTNLLGGVTSTASNLLGSSTGNLLGTVGSTLGSVTLGSTTLPLPSGVTATVSTTSSPTTLPIGLPSTGIIDPVLNTVGGLLSTAGLPTTGSLPTVGVIAPVLNTVGNILSVAPSTSLPATGSVPTVGLPTTDLLAPVLNTVGSILSTAPTASLPTTTAPTIGLSLSLNTLPVGQVLNTVANLASSLPVISAPTQGLTVPQVGVPVVPQPLLSTLTSTVANTISNLLSEPIQAAPAFNVDSSLTQGVKKVYNLQGGFIEIDFDFRTLASLISNDASLVVTLNNQPIFRVLASDSGKPIKISIPTKLPQGQYTIGFVPVQGLVNSVFSFWISNLFVYEKQILTQLTGNLITNGGFELNGCINNFCIWNFQTFLASFVNGWNPVPEIEVVRSLLVNPNIGNSWVAELDANANTCIVQSVVLSQGRQLLNFDWAARTNTALASNGILVIINRQLLKSIVPVDYALHTEALEFFINSNGAAVELAICGAGTSDSVGALIDNVAIRTYDEKLFKINKY